MDIQIIRGQSFDGATAMAGTERGAQALLRNVILLQSTLIAIHMF